MNTSPLHFSRLRRPRTCAVAFALLLSLVAPCHALTIYSVSINTSGLAGQTGTLAFDLVGGDAAVANNTATISSLVTNGTLGNSAGFSLSDTGFFNEELRAITFGTSLSFTLQLSENQAAPGLDQFSFFLLDASAQTPIGGTTDPTGANALFAIDINGQAGGSASNFGSATPGIAWQITLQQPPGSVPDNGRTLVLLILSAAGLLVARASEQPKQPEIFLG